MILITGGLGHIGSKLIRELPGNDILIVDSLDTQRYVSLFNLPSNQKFYFIEYKVQNLTENSLHKFNSIEAIIHLAAFNETVKYQKKKQELESNNLDATNKIVEIATGLNVPLIFPSSTSVYSGNSNLMTEDVADLNPLNFYAQTKLKEEKILNEASKKGLLVKILRLGTVYGTSPGMRFHTAINAFCYRHSIGLPIELWGSVDDIRPYLSLKDACSSIKFMLNNLNEPSSTYNVATSNSSLKDILMIIESISQRKLKIKNINANFAQSNSFSVSTTKIQELGFEFSGELSTEIAKTLELFGNIYE